MHPQSREILDKKDGPLAYYRLGRRFSFLKGGLRIPHGLPNKKAIDKSMAFLIFLLCAEYPGSPINLGIKHTAL